MTISGHLTADHLRLVLEVLAPLDDMGKALFLHTYDIEGRSPINNLERYGDNALGQVLEAAASYVEQCG